MYVFLPPACLLFGKTKGTHLISDPLVRVIDDCELSCGYWLSDPGPLEEQPLLLAQNLLSSPQFHLNLTNENVKEHNINKSTSELLEDRVS